MATFEFDEGDGIFRSLEDSYDEVDASAVFTVIERGSIPDKFILKAGMIVRERSQTFTLLPRSFGEHLGNVVETGGGQLGLLTLRGELLTPTTAFSVCKQLLTTSGLEHRVAPLRWTGRHLLVGFDAVETYENCGNQLLEGHLPAGPNHRVAALEPAIFSSVPKVLVNVTSQQGDDLHVSLADPIMPFSASFTHLRITTDPSAPAPLPQDKTPHLGLVLMFNGRDQVIALKTLSKLASSPWRPVSLPPVVEQALDPGISHFQNSLGGPLIGVNTSCSQAGVRIMVLIRSAESFDNMAQFYMNLLGVDSVSRQAKTANVRYTIFPLSSRSELMVAYFPGVQVSTSHELDLCVKVKDLSKVVTYDLAGGSVHLTDPEGNSVIASTTEVKL